KKDFTKPEATEVWKPVPAIVSPAPGDAPPSDAIVLFNGSNTDNWIMARDSQSCKWDLRDGILTAKPGTGDIKTKLAFADCQLHIEFMLPADVQKAKVRNDAGNSGVYLQERYEVQIFDSYQNGTPLYANGQCGSIYKQAIPLVNANNKPGEWNTFD